MGNRNRDIPACSIVRQPTTLPRAHVDACGAQNYRSPSKVKLIHAQEIIEVRRKYSSISVCIFESGKYAC
jgi:hypothetical protein